MASLKLVVSLAAGILLINIFCFYSFSFQDPLVSSQQTLLQDLPPPPPPPESDELEEVKYLQQLVEFGQNDEEQSKEGGDKESSEDDDESDDPDEFEQPENNEPATPDPLLNYNPEDLFDPKSISNKFINPNLALKLLTQLDIDSAIEKSFFSKEISFTKKHGKSKKYNDKYCEDHRAHIVNHPEQVFEGKNFIPTFKKRGYVRNVMLPMFDAVDLTTKENQVNGVQPDLRPDVNIFFMVGLWFYKRQVGKQYSCLTQISNHIPGHQKIYYKDSVGEALVQYAKQYESRPQCFGFTKFFPKTWVLKHKDQCEEFFAEFNSELYQKLKAERNVVYFRKIGANVHQGRGVFPVTDDEEEKIRKIYKNGNACGQVTDNNLIQYNVHNTVLVQNRKIGFRMFMLVASTNPVIAYYHNGYARLSVNEYDLNSKDKSTFVTNIHVNIKLATQGTSFEGLSEEEIQERTFWVLGDVHDYFYQNKMVKDPHWLENTLIPEFKKVMIHLIRLAQNGFFKQSSLYELYGLDFVMDENLDLWFIEGNTKPQISGFALKSKKLLDTMIYDSFEIVFALLRARMKRIVNYINFLTKEVTENGGEIMDIEEARREFKIISRNTFDPEFAVSASNGFHKIIDENYSGTNRFGGLIAEECL